jgi:glycine cleavage system H protein
VQPPDIGAVVVRDATCAEVESTKSVSDIYAPVSGTVVAVNEALATTPELLNSDPYGAGWIFRVEMSDATELDNLMDSAAYQAMVAS